MLDCDHLRYVLEYEPLTGDFTWRQRADSTARRNSQYAGKRAGRVNSNGYVQIKIDGVSYYAHRLAWLWLTGEFPASQIDHVNGDKADNSATNLREATPQQNAANRGSPITSISPFKGACFVPRMRAWQASIKVDGKSLHLGYHATAWEAHIAYVKAAEQHFGEFARAS